MRIAIIGAAGYVGQAVCGELKNSGHEVVAIARANSAIHLAHLGIAIESPDRARHVGRVDTVINLAYPKSVPAYDYARENRRILQAILTLAGDDARVVHASSLAVFGYAFEHAQAAGPVAKRRDYAYVESKILQEHLLLDRLRARDLHIVRLGNVWGPGSPTWTAALTDCILFGDPVGIAGRDGYCNATDVGNAASYLAYLAARPARSAPSFHHLAEFAEVRWSFWIQRIATELGIPARYAATAGAYPKSALQELGALLARQSPFGIARQALNGRYVASWLLDLLALLPKRQVERLEMLAIRRTTSAASALDGPFLEIMSTPNRISARVDPGWTPPLNIEDSWRRVQSWMRRAGYRNVTCQE